MTSRNRQSHKKDICYNNWRRHTAPWTQGTKDIFYTWISFVSLNTRNKSWSEIESYKVYFDLKNFIMKGFNKYSSILVCFSLRINWSNGWHNVMTVNTLSRQRSYLTSRIARVNSREKICILRDLNFIALKLRRNANLFPQITFIFILDTKRNYFTHKIKIFWTWNYSFNLPYPVTRWL
jgi:hypothetical protein